MFNNLDKNNLHHAYLLEGNIDTILPELREFLNELGVDTIGNADFTHISVDSFRMEDAKNIKSFSAEKGMKEGKRIFLISANNFLLEAQNTLLKMFEEPIANTHFFLVVPDKNSLLKTLVSRFYTLSTKASAEGELKVAEDFIKLPLPARLEFIKELLSVPEEEGDEEETVILNSSRSKALKFLNALESTLHKKLVSRTVLDTSVFEHFFKVRKYLRMPGSSAKSMMESVAVILPKF